MTPRAIVSRLVAEAGRGAGTDAERRAAGWLRDHLRADGRPTSLQAAWVRPYSEITHCVHAALAVAGSLLSAWQPAVGLAVLAVTLVSLVGDLTGRLELVRRLTPLRATQSVVSPPRPRAPGQPEAGVRLTVCAHTDSPRTGAAHGDLWAAGEAALRRSLRGHLPSGLGLLTGAVTVLVVMAGLRLGGVGGAVLGTVQVLPTLVAIVAFGALSDIALSDFSPGAAVDASGVAVALALVAELDAAPPRHLEVELVLAGAGIPGARGMRAWVDRQRRQRRGEDTVILAIEPCGRGTPRWLERDGELFPLRLHPRLVELAHRAADDDPGLRARPYRSHGCTSAYPARQRRWPALAVGARDQHDRVPGAGTSTDTVDGVEDEAMRATLSLCLGIIGRLDDHLAQVAGE